jgi:hypothetical protein
MTLGLANALVAQILRTLQYRGATEAACRMMEALPLEAPTPLDAAMEVISLLQRHQWQKAFFQQRRLSEGVFAGERVLRQRYLPLRCLIDHLLAHTSAGDLLSLTFNAMEERVMVDTLWHSTLPTSGDVLVLFFLRRCQYARAVATYRKLCEGGHVEQDHLTPDRSRLLACYEHLIPPHDRHRITHDRDFCEKVANIHTLPDEGEGEMEGGASEAKSSGPPARRRGPLPRESPPPREMGRGGGMQRGRGGIHIHRMAPGGWRSPGVDAGNRAFSMSNVPPAAGARAGAGGARGGQPAPPEPPQRSIRPGARGMNLIGELEDEDGDDMQVG